MPAINSSSPIMMHYVPPTAAQDSGSGDGIFHHLLNIINPLQHLPLIGTLYRAVTHEHLGGFDKIAGDTLYGGFWGGVTAAADVALEAVTGKSAEDTVLALFDGGKDETPKTMASAAPTPVMAPAMAPAATPKAMPATPAATTDMAALSNALSGKGIDGALASRALEAYRKTVSFQQMPVLAAAQ